MQGGWEVSGGGDWIWFGEWCMLVVFVKQLFWRLMDTSIGSRLEGERHHDDAHVTRRGSLRGKMVNSLPLVASAKTACRPDHRCVAVSRGARSPYRARTPSAMARQPRNAEPLA